MKKKLIALFFGANALALGGDAVTDNIPKIEAKDIPVAEEVVKIKEVDNVVEAEFSWKDAMPIKVSYDLGEPTLAEKIKDARDASIITETVTAFDGGFKIDILLEKIPASNVFCYAIEGSESYDFFYQPPLTPEEMAEGASRPPEIEGSYAVYHKTLKNHVLGKENYATGKVMHIPRPQVWSMLDVETKVWADMNYQDGQLCVTVPQDFLNKAKYPVRVDPTFGYTSIGATSNTIANVTNDASTMRGGAFVVTASGSLTSMSAAFRDSVGSVATDVFIALFREDSNGTGSHDLVVGLEEADLSEGTTAAFTTINASSEALSADTYVLAVLGNGEDRTSGVLYVMTDFGGVTRNSYSESTNGAGSYAARKSDSPWDEAASAGFTIDSIYATYTADAGQTVTEEYFADTTWTAPPGITSITVKAWGGGGKGGTRSTNGVGGGGGGGAYASSVVSVVPGNDYDIVIGAGGTTTGASGGNTTFNSTTVVAAGGTGVAENSATGAAGGSLAASTGDTEAAGGAGGNGTAGTGGGGGGEAGGSGGTGAAGSAGSAGGTGGSGVNDPGGDGGAGRLSPQGAGVAGQTPGGGGGGAYMTSTGPRLGGNGARGYLTITYTASGGGSEPTYKQDIFWFD